MPEGFSAEERACWQGLVRELESVPGLLARADRGVLELLARLEPQMRAASAVIRDMGPTVQTCDKDGHLRLVKTRPEAGFLLKIVALCKGLYGELGLTPSGRSRVSLTPAAPTSKLDTFLSKGKPHGA
jgi:P27 family predicted phage terminase small subunit